MHKPQSQVKLGFFELKCVGKDHSFTCQINSQVN